MQVGLVLAAFFIGELRELFLYVGFLLSLSAATTVAWLFLPSILEERGSRKMFGEFGVALVFIVATYVKDRAS